MEILNDKYSFLADGGKMGGLIRKKDWATTTIGNPNTWPQSLCNMIGLILNNPVGMGVIWGEEELLFFNDSFSKLLNIAPDASSLDANFKDFFKTPLVINSILEDVKKGKSILSHHQLDFLLQKNKNKNYFFDYAFNPIYEQGNTVRGIFITLIEVMEKTKPETDKPLRNHVKQLLGTLKYITKEKEYQKELEESEKRYRNMVMESPIPKAILKGENMQIEIANHTLLNKIWRKKQKEVQDKKLFELFPELQEQKYASLLNKVYNTGEIHSESESLLIIKGDIEEYRLYIDFEFAPLIESDYSISGIKITLIDVTEKVEARKKVEESEKRFRFLTESIPQLIWETDEKGKPMFTSAKWFEYTGKGKLSLDDWKTIIHPDDLDENTKTWQNCLITGTTYKSDVRLLNKDGNYRWHAVIGEPVLNKDHKIIKWVGAYTDIHTEKAFTHELEKQVTARTKQLSKINASLQKSEERYHLMVEEVQDYAILYLNHDGIIKNWNLGAEKIKGYKADEIVGQYFSVFYTEIDQKNHLPNKLLQLAREKGKAIQEGWRVRKDKSLFWASVVITAVHNKKSEVIGFSKVTHDLTDKKNGDDQLKLYALELKQKNIELEKMNQELQSFAYISSHDLQEPLRKIQTFASLILDQEFQNLSEKGKEKFQKMQSAAQRMQTLINDLLSYSRTTSKDRKFVKMDLSVIINEVQEDLKEDLQLKQATIETDLKYEVAIIPFQFRQLIYNLISNSIKFSKPNVLLQIKIKSELGLGKQLNNETLSENTSYYHICFSDNGIGFDQQYSTKIFEVFQRLHGKDLYKGTGIGLAIVKKIVENHNGIITAFGKENMGATFDLFIPVT